jgi:hypothetical protein
MADQSVEAKRDEIDRWHRDRGFNSFGYHYLIDRDGQTCAGRGLEEQGAHTYGHNDDSIGICLVGGHGSSSTDAFSTNYTDAQDQALRVLINELKIRIPTIKKVSGHNDYTNAKACPGFKVERWLANKPPERKLVESKTMQASTMQIASGVGTGIGAVAALDGTAQLVAIGFAGLSVLLALIIMRERLQKWAKGDR